MEPQTIKMESQTMKTEPQESSGGGGGYSSFRRANISKP